MGPIVFRQQTPDRTPTAKKCSGIVSATYSAVLFINVSVIGCYEKGEIEK